MFFLSDVLPLVQIPHKCRFKLWYNMCVKYQHSNEVVHLVGSDVDNQLYCDVETILNDTLLRRDICSLREIINQHDFYVRVSSILPGILKHVAEMRRFPSLLGYCPGINYIAFHALKWCLISHATTIDTSLADTDIAKEVVRLVCFILKDEGGLGLRHVFENELSGLFIRVDTLNNYVRSHLPQIFDHFKTFDIPLQIIVSPWLLTLFSNCKPLPAVTVAEFWDWMILDGFKVNSVVFYIFCYDDCTDILNVTYMYDLCRYEGLL